MKKIDAIDEKDFLFNKMLDLIAKQNYTKKQIKDKLFAKTKNIELIDEILDKLEKYGYVDDCRFAEQYVKNYSSAHSKREMEYKMMLKGVPQKDIKQSLEEIEDETGTAKYVAEKYMRSKVGTIENVQKLYGYLFGKGFSGDVISKIVREYKQKFVEEQDD